MTAKAAGANGQARAPPPGEPASPEQPPATTAVTIPTMPCVWTVLRGESERDTGGRDDPEEQARPGQGSRPRCGESRHQHVVLGRQNLPGLKDVIR